jgi:excisionase family DNA binding protein
MQTTATESEPSTRTAEEGAVSVADACRFTGLGRTYLYSLMDKGELAYTRVGKRRLIFRAALVALLRHGAVASVGRTGCEQEE